MSVQNILDANGKIDPAYIGAAASYGFVTNPLSAPLQCFNPTTLTNHPILEASYVSASSVKTDNLEQLPGSLQTRIRVDTNLQMATGRDLQFETNGIITAGGGAAQITLTDAAAVGDVSITTTGNGSSINMATDGGMFIYTQTADSSISMGANNSTAEISIDDVAGVGSIGLDGNTITIAAGQDGSIAEMRATNSALTNEARVNLDGDNASAQLSGSSATGSASFTADGLGGNVAMNATNSVTMTATNAVNITSGFTDVTLTASLGQIYQLGGQRVRTRFVSSAFYNPVVSDYAICMENAGGSTLTLPLITAANVGKQYLILHNSTAGALSVQTALGSGQTIFSSTGAASANPRSLPIGHCHTFTAMQVSGFPVAYGWAMI